MKRLLALLVLLAFGCGGTVQTGARPTIEQLRERAEDEPDDPDAQRQLAFGEMLLSGGDPERAAPALARALSLSPRDERLLYLSALHEDSRGDPDRALTLYLEALERAAESEHPQAPFVAEVAVAGIGELDQVAPRFIERVTEVYRQLVERPRQIGAAAHHGMSITLIELAYRRGDMEAVRRRAAEQGCLTEWRVAGPFGPRSLLSFDDTHADAVDRGPLADVYDLGPGRGERPTRELTARGCAVHLGGGPAADSGTTYAESFVEIPTTGDYFLRLETPNAVEAWVDGQRAVRLDARVEPTPRITFHRLTMEAGRHEITIKVTTRHPNPIVVASITSPDGRAPGEGGGTFTVGRPEGDDLFSPYLRAVVARARGDVIGAREALRGEMDGADTSVHVLSLAAAVAVADPLASDDVRRDEARRLFRMVRRRDPMVWNAALSLALLDAGEGRAQQAIEALELGRERWPQLVHFPLHLVDLYVGRGWLAHADRAVEQAREVAPDACRPLRAELDSAERRNRWTEVVGLADRLVSCDARSNAKYQTLVRRRSWEEADRELSRLGSLEPSHDRFGELSARLDLARSRGDTAAMDRILEELTDIQPRSSLSVMGRVDLALAAGDDARAQTLLDTSIAAEPTALAELRLLRRAITGEFALTPYRLDGGQALREFRDSGRSYEEPAVLVLDYTVIRIFDDGSLLELTHNIWSIQSEEAVDEHGEFAVPDGARVLTLRTVKADGRRIEPDHIAGKDTISLPSLAPGDFVEYEYVRTGEAPPGFPAGYLGDRFYFRSFETPFDLSQLTIVMPASMEPMIDPRGPAPETETRTEDGQRVLRWTARESRPLVPEPMSVPPREYVPSINVGVGATWEAFFEGLVDQIADRDVRDPRARRLVRRILGDARNASPDVKARRLYRWVLDNVEHNNDFFGLAPAMLSQRTGNRARILRYMLRLAGVRAQIVLARSIVSDATESELADPETYQHPLVLIGSGDDATFLHTGDRGAPYGYIPSHLRGREARVLARGARLLRLPPASTGQDRRTVEVDVHLDDDGSATVEVVETHRGDNAVRWRQDLQEIPEATLEERFEEAYVARLVPGASMTELRITGRENPEQPLVLQYAFEVRALGRRQGGTWVVPGIFPTNLGAAYAAVGERTTAQLIASAVDVDVIQRIHASSLPEAPETVQLQGPNGAAFQLSATRSDGVMTLERKVRLPIGRIPAAQYPQLARFCRAADAAENRELRIPVR